MCTLKGFLFVHRKGCKWERADSRTQTFRVTSGITVDYQAIADTNLTELHRSHTLPSM